jgi:hypothetical protein
MRLLERSWPLRRANAYRSVHANKLRGYVWREPNRDVASAIVVRGAARYGFEGKGGVYGIR